MSWYATETTGKVLLILCVPIFIHSEAVDVSIACESGSDSKSQCDEHKLLFNPVDDGLQEFDDEQTNYDGSFTK